MKNKKNASEEPEEIRSDTLFPVVGIGASAGGLDAFKKLLGAIPQNSGMAYVLVQHLHPDHESMLPGLLQKVTSIPVVEIRDDIKILPDHIYIIPSNKMLLANDGRLDLSPRLEKRIEKNSTIDLFFTSLAEVHQSHAIGVVLSGTASDGTLGLKAIKDYGGITFAQDEASAEFGGMPESAVHAGVVDFILAPEKIPLKILELSRITNANDGDGNKLSGTEEDSFKQIISLLHLGKGTDFTFYKQSTIRRRILRRMALNQKENLQEYLKDLRASPTAQDVLYQDLLIPVTGFFRDNKSFESFKDSVLPRILKNKSFAPSESEPVRIWVAGCSTGEEAYTIAICIKEFLGHHNRKVQIFASDISEPAIEKARKGAYSKNEVEGLTPQRLNTFFTKANGGYQLSNEIRDMCVFAIHNFIKDPPFGRMDFISCRNVLMYLEPYLQKKSLTTFHYALNKGGFLMLGKAETISSVPELFSADLNNNKIFARKDVMGKFMHIASLRTEHNLQVAETDRNYPDGSFPDFQRIADDILLRKYTPAGVVINEAMDIVHFRGSTVHFLEQSAGKPTHHLLKMVKHGLAPEIRSLLHKVKKVKTGVLKDNIPVQMNDSVHIITLEVIPLPDSIEPYYLILFHDHPIKAPRINPGSQTGKSLTNEEDKDLRIEHLESELLHVREDMRSITEDQDEVNEELQSANEELLSNSEELQTLNEELETRKEELQSTNEELTVVNHELLSMNEQVILSRDYAENIISTIRQPLLVLDRHLRIRTANKSFYKTFKVNEQETEGVLIYDLGNGQWNIQALRTLLENILPQRTKFNDCEIRHNFPNIGERTMLLNAMELKTKSGDDRLILLAMEDVTEKQQASYKIKESEKLFRFIAESMPQKVWTADAQGRRNYFNGQWLEYTGFSPDELKDEGWKKIVHPEDLAKTEKLWLEAVEKGSDFEVEDRKLNKEGSYLWHLSRATPFKDPSGNILMWVGTNTEIEKQKTYSVELEKAVADRTQELQKAIEDLRQSEHQIQTVFEVAPDAVITINHHGIITNWNAEAESIFGWLKEEAVGNTLTETIIPERFREQHINGLKNFMKHGEGRVLNKPIEISALRKDNSEIPVELKISASVTQKSDPVFIGFVRDISIRKQNEAQLKARAEQIAEKNTELQKINKELESFTYISSHDLQEPLRKIQTFAGRIMDKEVENLSDSGKNMFMRMREAGQTMQTLIQDLLAFARLNTTESNFEITNINEIINQVEHDLREVIDEKKAIIEVSEMCEFNVIRFQFHQLMQNLISNALKFSKPNIPPHIIIRDESGLGHEFKHPNLSPEKTYCHISVTDNGIGFEPEFSEKIFEVFQRLHGRDEFAGTGIGLAIVKKIVENHGGVITASSQPGNGARFDIYIPGHENHQ